MPPASLVSHPFKAIIQNRNAKYILYFVQQKQVIATSKHSLVTYDYNRTHFPYWPPKLYHNFI